MNTQDPEHYAHFEKNMIKAIQDECVAFLIFTSEHFSKHGDKWGPKDGLIYPLYTKEEVYEIYKSQKK